MPKVKFVVEHQVVDAKPGQQLRALALDSGISLDREFFRGVNCNGRGICGCCKVWVRPLKEGALNPPNLRERIHGMGNGRRLACQAEVLGDVEVNSMPGGDDRLNPKRAISPAPVPALEPEAPRKPIDEASSIAYPLGHPSALGSGTPPSTRPDCPAALPAKVEDKDSAKPQPKAEKQPSRSEDAKPASKTEETRAESEKAACSEAKETQSSQPAGEGSEGKKGPEDKVAEGKSEEAAKPKESTDS